MRIRVLGAAAGGGLPQWNCTCTNCSALRNRQPHIQSRTQSQLAFSADGEAWYLVNASPDLREQLNQTPVVHPDPSKGLRNTPVEGVILTSADLDHVLGLLLMREFTPVRIYATETVRSILQANSFFQMLDRLPGQSRWTTIEPGISFSEKSGFTCTPIAIPGSFPSYVAEEHRIALDGDSAVVGLLLESAQGKRIAYLPALPSVSSSLKSTLSTCSVILVDGTFWSDDELQRIHSMGHLSISGPEGSLAAFRDCADIRKIYTHINNTNPILNEQSRERQLLEDAGWEVAYDGMEITL
jgi:pyrroloquinoline quinone biosynthesis protein B